MQTNADYTTDDNNPAVTFKNIGGGQGIQVISGASIEGILVSNTTLQGATIAPIRVIASVASQAVLAISGVFVSTASMNLTAANTAFHIPVYHQSQSVLGFIAVSKGPA